MKEFKGIVVPIVIHKRQRLGTSDSGLSYSNYNATTCKGNNHIRAYLSYINQLFLMEGVASSSIDAMKKMVLIVSENSAAGHKKMTDKVLGHKVHQFLPEPFSAKTLMVLCASTRYLSHIGVLEDLFRHDQKIAGLTQCCKFVNMCFDVKFLPSDYFTSMYSLDFSRSIKIVTSESNYGSRGTLDYCL